MNGREWRELKASEMGFMTIDVVTNAKRIQGTARHRRAWLHERSASNESGDHSPMSRDR